MGNEFNDSKKLKGKSDELKDKDSSLPSDSSRITHYASRSLERGFTLLEVLVALAILGIALLAVVRLFSANLREISASGDYVNAAARAEAKLRDVLDDDALAEKTATEQTDDGYRIDTSIKEALKSRTDNLQVKVMEVGVTVDWRRGTKNKSVTLKTLKVVGEQP